MNLATNLDKISRDQKHGTTPSTAGTTATAPDHILIRAAPAAATAATTTTAQWGLIQVNGPTGVKAGLGVDIEIIFTGFTIYGEALIAAAIPNERVSAITQTRRATTDAFALSPVSASGPVPRRAWAHLVTHSTVAGHRDRHGAILGQSFATAPTATAQMAGPGKIQ